MNFVLCMRFPDVLTNKYLDNQHISISWQDGSLLLANLAGTDVVDI